MSQDDGNRPDPEEARRLRGKLTRLHNELMVQSRQAVARELTTLVGQMADSVALMNWAADLSNVVTDGGLSIAIPALLALHFDVIDEQEFCERVQRLEQEAWDNLERDRAEQALPGGEPEHPRPYPAQQRRPLIEALMYWPAVGKPQ